MLSDVRLRVVPIELVRPHEIADPGREQRIERRLASDGMLRDPVLVGEIPNVEGYVLLDGTNRTRALENLGLRGVLAQVIDYADVRAVQLRTWCHSTGMPADDILARIAGIVELQVESLSPLAAPDALHDPGTLAVLLDRGHRLAITCAPTTERFALLRKFVDIYEGTLTRVDCDPETIEEVAARSETTGSCLIAFPPFTRAQVVALATKATPIPAGITRHVILSGRALRINLPLDLLKLEGGIESANQKLDRHLAELTPRVYGEPTILFDS